MGLGHMQPDQVACHTDQPTQHRGTRVGRQQIRQRCSGELHPHRSIDRDIVTTRLDQGNVLLTYTERLSCFGNTMRSRLYT
jgi:hypothetical protein